MGALGYDGLIIGADIPMLWYGAMEVGPLGGWLMKKTDKFLDGKFRWFEMVVNNFSIGIIGFPNDDFILSIDWPDDSSGDQGVTNAIEALVSTGFLPLLSLFNEPAKVLFLNNVIDQGVYYPLGMQQTLMLENQFTSWWHLTWAWFGIVIGLFILWKKAAKRTAPGAIIIHFFVESMNYISLCLNETDYDSFHDCWWNDWNHYLPIVWSGLVAGPKVQDQFSLI